MDELIQLAHNADPLDGTEQDCEQFYYALQNANFNVLGLIAETGEVVERYEYTPYGQRAVYTTAGSADPAAHTPTLMSQRVELAGVAQPYALNLMGHQGLMHDEATNLIYNRARMLHPRLGRFLQRDPLGYVDGMSVYEYVGSNSLFWLDPNGLWSFLPWVRDTILGIDSVLVDRNQNALADRARTLGRDDLAIQALDVAKEFDRDVGKRAGHAFTETAGNIVTFHPDYRAYMKCYSACAADGLINAGVGTVLPGAPSTQFVQYATGYHSDIPVSYSPYEFASGSLAGAGRLVRDQLQQRRHHTIGDRRLGQIERRMGQGRPLNRHQQGQLNYRRGTDRLDRIGKGISRAGGILSAGMAAKDFYDCYKKCSCYLPRN